MKRSAARWHEFARVRGPDVPTDLRAVVAEVAGRLGPTLGELS
jgi:hypothetical protein